MIPNVTFPDQMTFIKLADKISPDIRAKWLVTISHPFDKREIQYVMILCVNEESWNKDSLEYVIHI